MTYKVSFSSCGYLFSTGGSCRSTFQNSFSSFTFLLLFLRFSRPLEPRQHRAARRAVRVSRPSHRTRYTDAYGACIYTRVITVTSRTHTLQAQQLV